jgi:hypothetical protein
LVDETDVSSRADQYTKNKRLPVSPVIFFQQATIGQKWNISQDFFEYPGDLKLQLQYQTSNYIGDANVAYQLLDAPTCKIPVTMSETKEGPDGAPFWAAQSFFGFGDPQNSNGLGTRGYLFEINVNGESMPNNVLVFQDSPGRPATAQIRFCHRFSLSTGDIEVNYLETLVTLDVDLTDGFEIASITVDVKRDEADAEQAHEVEAEFCKGEPPVPLSPSEIDDIRYPGAALQVCVRPTKESINNGLYMSSIDEFTWTRIDTITGASVEQVAIDRFGAASNGLTDVYCPEDGDSYVCYFKTLLKANFYQLVLKPPTLAPSPAPAAAEIPFGGEFDGGEADYGQPFDRATIAPTVSPMPTWISIPDSTAITLFNAEASSSARRLSAADLTDSDTSTAWTSASGQEASWLQFDMNGFFVVKKIHIHWKGLLFGNRNNDIEVSLDGTTEWTSVGAVYVEDYAYPDIISMSYIGQPTPSTPLFGRYIRISMNRFATNQNQYSISEVKVWGYDYPFGDPSYAISANSATASSTWHSGVAASNVIDGNADTYWRSSTSEGADWVTVDLVETSSFDSVKIEWYGTWYPETVAIELSEDNSLFLQATYHVIGTRENKDLISTIESSNGWQDARYLRISIKEEWKTTFTGIRNISVKGHVTFPVRSKLALSGLASAAIDGDLQTHWETTDELGSVEFSLDGWFALTSFYLVWDGSFYPSSYRIELSDDGITWSGFGAGGTGREIGGTSDFTEWLVNEYGYADGYVKYGRRVRIQYVGFGQGIDAYRLKEINVYGYPLVPAPDFLPLFDPRSSSGNGTVAFAIDGDSSTTWVSEPGDEASWVEFDLGGQGFVLTNLYIKFLGNAYPRYVYFRVKSQKSSYWKNVMSMSLYSGGRNPAYDSPQFAFRLTSFKGSSNYETGARYVQIWCPQFFNATIQDHYAISEFSVEGFQKLHQPYYIYTSYPYTASSENSTDLPYHKQDARYAFHGMTKGNPTASQHPDCGGNNCTWVSAQGEATSWVQASLRNQVVTQVLVESKNELYPTKYAIQVAEEEEEPFTWQTLSTVSVPAGQETSYQWTDVSDPITPIYANAFRLLCLEHNTGQTQYSIYNIDINGYEEHGDGYQNRKLGEAEDNFEANAGGEPEKDHRRLLEVVEDEAGPPKKDHRELQGVSISGAGIATLKFPGGARRRTLRNTERRREQQETDSGRPLGGAQFGLDINVFPLIPLAVTSSALVAGHMWAFLTALSLAVLALLG